MRYKTVNNWANSLNTRKNSRMPCGSQNSQNSQSSQNSQNSQNSHFKRLENASSASAVNSTFIQPPAPLQKTFLGKVANIGRSIIGKPPVSLVRETVKTILEIYSDQLWNQLPKVRKEAVAAIDLARKDTTDPLTHIYLEILELFGNRLNLLITKEISEPLVPNYEILTEILDAVVERRKLINTNSKVVTKLIERFPTISKRNPQDNEKLKKITDLVESALNGALSFYDARIELIKVARTTAATLSGQPEPKENKNKNNSTMKFIAVVTPRNTRRIMLSHFGGKSKRVTKTRKMRL